MKNAIVLLLIGFFVSTNVIPLASASVSFANDYVLQDRFAKSLSKAKMGIAKAQYRVGEMFEKGRGTETNIKEAFDWYQKAAHQRHIKAQYKLGYMHYKGLGVKRNVDKAYKHLKKPASKGYVRAQYYLGKLYADGHGVIKDPKKALIWYSRASLGGFSPAEEELVIIRKLLAEIDQSKQKVTKVVKTRVVKTRVVKKSIKTPVLPKKEKVFKSDSVKTKASNLNTVIKKILVGGWANRKRPSEFLPSKLTQCEKTSSSIMECLSRKLLRNNGTADIVYITKALLYDIDDSGEFKVAYRNNVLEVIEHEQVSDEEDDEEVSGVDEDDEDEEVAIVRPKSTVKKGWQETEHQLVCQIKDKGSINCVKNKTRRLVYNRKIKT